ncbi:MAG: DUF5069 domain-containing protein [Nitrospirales bacterium]
MVTTVQSTNRTTSTNETASKPKTWATKENTTMSNEPQDWIEQFRALFNSKVTVYENGIHNAKEMFSKDEETFLSSIGATPQEIFDFVEDWCEDGTPDPETVLALTKIRQDYLSKEQQGKLSKKIIREHEFPSRSASLADLEWFPRIIEKARAKLRGELPEDLMYSCGGDRRFLKKINMGPVEFLQTVREAGDNIDHIVKMVTDRSNT